MGNGVVDPSGQGADGLDFLANLSFTNFAPSVGCILGDEYGDGQHRSFGRTNLAFNIGQGIFHLDPEFSDVFGTRLQQFHVSPQVAGVVGEENANLIELSIPLAELGGLKPGDVVRIGAIVGGSGCDLQNQTRFLDSGFLGSRLTGSGFDSVVLEGIPVRLAFDPEGDDDHDGLVRSRELEIGTDPEKLDSDGDGLPDGWEVEHQLNPLLTEGMDGAGGDPDGDGASNREEFAAGTDPRASASAFRVEAQWTGTRRLSISWLAVAGLAYHVQSSTNSMDGFQDVPGAAFPGSPVATPQVYEIAADPLEPRAQFFRVRLVRALENGDRALDRRLVFGPIHLLTSAATVSLHLLAPLWVRVCAPVESDSFLR